MIAAPAAATGYDELNAGIQLWNLDDWAQSREFLDQALAAGDLTPNQKFVALLDRADDHQKLKNTDLALADYTAALALQPASVVALLGRATTYESAEKYDLAIADIDAVIAIRPLFVDIYGERARLHILQGQYDKARADLRTALSILPEDTQGRDIGIIDWQLGLMPEARTNLSWSIDHGDGIYGWLWIALVDLRMGKDVSRRYLPDYDKAKWPAPIVAFFLGKAPQQSVFDQAGTDTGGEGGIKGQACEADFYVGEFLLQHHDAAGAAPLIHKAAAECRKGFLEWEPAQFDQAGLP